MASANKLGYAGSLLKMGGSGPVEVDETYIVGKAKSMHFEESSGSSLALISLCGTDSSASSVF